MKFNKDHKVDINTLTKEDAEEFVWFLEDEMERHFKAQVEASHISREKLDYPPSYRRFYKSAALRHEEDIKDIQNLIKQVKEMYSL